MMAIHPTQSGLASEAPQTHSSTDWKTNQAVERGHLWVTRSSTGGQVRVQIVVSLFIGLVSTVLIYLACFERIRPGFGPEVQGIVFVLAAWVILALLLVGLLKHGRRFPLILSFGSLILLAIAQGFETDNKALALAGLLFLILAQLVNVFLLARSRPSSAKEYKTIGSQEQLRGDT